jgi:hypothetical protein
MKKAKLPIGIQDFEKLITENFVYVDKTEFVYQLANAGNPTFLCRPRRFGKSVLVSTFDALFTAKRELFKGLWINNSDWDWQVHPVIRLDMSVVPNRTLELFESGLAERLTTIATRYGIDLTAHQPAQTLLLQLIEKLAAKYTKVVVLVDEYDKPLIDQIENLETAHLIRDSLRQFYGILKAQDANLKFVFLTGVTKFSKVSVFSGLNNLNDITMLDNFSTLLGYTRDELEHYFGNDIADLAATRSLTLPACYAEIKKWYNGYRFSRQSTYVYNPFSVLRLINSSNFSTHWFETGTPTFLIKLLQNREFDLIDLETLEVSDDAFSTFEIDNIPLLPLLYQTGYLTIKNYEPILKSFYLSHPNHEVSLAFSESLFRYFSDSEAESSNYITLICRNLLATPWDDSTFFTIFKEILALMPYDLYLKKEKHYQSLLYLVIKLAGLKVSAEVHTQRGRVDAVIEMKDKILIFEFKLNQTAALAIEQIKQKAYYQLYQDRKLPIYLVGINFNSEQHTIDDTRVEKL